MKPVSDDRDRAILQAYEHAVSCIEWLRTGLATLA
jgi:hypothetical protein